MVTFFRSWRRKAGLLTLVLACLFLVGWVRSDRILDRVELSIGSQRLTIYSFHRKIYVAWRQDDVLAIRWNSTTISNHKQATLIVLELDFSIHDCHGWTFSYWAFVTPLTLASAYLLVGNPRSSKTPVRSNDTATESPSV